VIHVSIETPQGSAPDPPIFRSTEKFCIKTQIFGVFRVEIYVPALRIICARLGVRIFASTKNVMRFLLRVIKPVHV
jgi:hypothetical protein